MSRKASPLLLFGAVVAANLLVFILAAQFLFLGPLHHHWVFPFETFLLGTQYIFFTARRWPPAQAAALCLLGLVALVAVIRWETIHTCVEHCGPKVFFSLAWVVACLAAGRFFHKKA